MNTQMMSRGPGGPAYVDQIDNVRPIIGHGGVITTSGSSQQSTVAPAGTRAVWIDADAACWVAIGVNPTAVAATGAVKRVKAGREAWFPCAPGERVAIIGDGAAPTGPVDVTYMG